MVFSKLYDFSRRVLILLKERKKDLTGQKFGKLTVMEFLPEGVEGKRGKYYRCICECGNEASVLPYNLISGHTKSCGCLPKCKPKDLTGQKFGLLTAIRLTGERERTNVCWLCRCDCGNEITVSSNKLICGNTWSCGCQKSSFRDLSDQKFGKLTAIKHLDGRMNKGSEYWQCACECGNEVIVPSSKLIQGLVKSCGICDERTKESSIFEYDLARKEEEAKYFKLFFEKYYLKNQGRSFKRI